MKKRLLGMAAVLGLALGMSVLSTKSVKAADYTDEPLVFDVNYVGDYVGKYDKGEVDRYKLVVPSDGVVTIHCVDKSHYSLGCAFESTDKYGIVTRESSESAFNKVQYNLAEGEYVIVFYADFGSSYNIIFEYNFNSSTTAKLSSPAQGKIKVTAPKGGRVDGYEVRYKKKGAKDWTTKNVKTTKTLNKTFSGIAKKTTYIVQTRKYVKDSYGYTYYSDWTEEQTVTTK